MSKTAQFPQKRLDEMAQASQVFLQTTLRQDALRADGLSENAMAILADMDPVLAFQLQTGMKVKHRKDASESLWFARQLEYIRPGLLEVLYPDLEGTKFVPVNTAIPPGAETYVTRAYDKAGKAQILKSYSDDIPRSDVKGVEAVQMLVGIATMYGYTLQELRAAMLAGLPLDVRKAMSARYHIERLHDEIIFYGSSVPTSTSTLYGLTNLTNTTTFTTYTGAKGSQLWRNKSPDEVVRDLSGIVNTVVKSTYGIHRPDTILLPLAAYNIAASTRMGDGSNQTILDFFLATNPYCKTVFPTYRLDQSQSANWSGTTGRMVAYCRDPMKVEALMPMQFSQLPPQQEHLEIRTVCEGRAGGISSPYPGSLAYGDAITDTTD
jgi:hypothetical protein